MNKKNLSLLIVAAVIYSNSALAQLLINYDFESIDLASGPDTFGLFEKNNADVSISSLYAVSGRHSLHIKDTNGNGAFAEFQGYFPEQSTRQVDIHFAIMTPNPSEEFNFAVAGTGHFNLSLNGHFIWLVNDGQFLHHVTDGVRKKLMPMPAYEWLSINVTLDLDKSSYSLEIHNESGELLVTLKDQVSASNRPGSNVQKYSFISELGDASSADYFIDDFSMRLHSDKQSNGFVAPGRRDLFIDIWQKYYREIEAPTHCMPSIVATDFVYDGDQIGLGVLKENLKLLRVLLAQPSFKTLNSLKTDNELMNGVLSWSKGCAYLKHGQVLDAVDAFEASQRLLGNVPAVQLAISIAYAQTDKVYSSEAIMSYHQAQHPNDIRWNVVQAMIGFLTYQEGVAEQALESVANYLKASTQEKLGVLEDAGWLREAAVLNARRDVVWSEQLQFFLVAEQYYFALLWQEKYQQASDYAIQIIEVLGRFNYTSSVWQERLADVALMAKDLQRAERHYLSVLEYENLPYWTSISVRQKLSDVYFLQNRPEKEKKTREAIFGALNYE